MGYEIPDRKRIKVTYLMMLLKLKNKFYGGTGYIKKINEDGTLDMHLQQSESEEFRQRVKQSQVTGCLSKCEDVAFDAATNHKYKVFTDLRKAMQIKDDRIMRCGEQSSYASLQLDADGKKLYLGDLVHIVDEFNEYYEWTGRIKSLGPGKVATVELGMPPAAKREDDEEDEMLRSKRPEELSQKMLAKFVRLVGKNIP